MTLVSPTQATIIDGAPCKVAGQLDGQHVKKQATDFMLYSCVKVNSKLLWKSIKYSKSAYSPNGANLKKLIATRANVVYPGEGKKCVVGDCALGSVGPGGGIVFYDAGSLKSWGRYLEVAPVDWTGRSEKKDGYSTWCDPGDPVAAIRLLGNVNVDPKIMPFTGLSIGLGKVHTAKLLEKCPLGAALPITNYVGGNTADWFLPSTDELNALCKFSYGHLNTTPDVICDSVGKPRGSFSKNLYWSSSQASLNGISAPIALGFWFGATTEFPAFSNFEPTPSERSIRPIRAFGSPDEKLVDAGVVQQAGAGASNWPARCPIVIDSQKSDQPKVTAITFDNSGAKYLRVKDNSDSAVTTSSNLIGCYANLDQIKDGGSFFDVGSINRDKKGYFWQNGGGDTVGGRIRLTLNGSVLTATTGNPQTISLVQ